MPADPSAPTPGLYSFRDFSPALTQDSILTCRECLPSALMIQNMITLSTYLITIENRSNFFGPRSKSSYSPSLRVLHARLINGYIAPLPLPSQFLTPAHTALSTRANIFSGKVHQRPLADFQDMYYALMARIREMQKRMSDHVRSGFSTPDTLLFPSGPTLANLHDILWSRWELLNDAAAGKAMDEAVREARVQCIQDEIVLQVESNLLSGEEAELQIMQLREKNVYEAQPGLEWTPEWDPALVNAKLAEKYRIVLEECRKMDKKEGGRVKLLQRKKMEFGGTQTEEEVAAAPAEQAVRGTINGPGVEVIETSVEDGPIQGELNVDRHEQEWMWQVEQMQHPAFCPEFSVKSQQEQDLALMHADKSHLRDVESNATVQDVDLVGQFEVAQPVQQHSHQQMQPGGPTIAACQEDNESDLERAGWRNEVGGRGQRVSRYTSFLRSLYSVHDPSSNDDGSKDPETNMEEALLRSNLSGYAVGATMRRCEQRMRSKEEMQTKNEVQGGDANERRDPGPSWRAEEVITDRGRLWTGRWKEG